MKFRKKPVVIDAIKYTGKNGSNILHWMFPDIEQDAEANKLTIRTLEGEMNVSIGDWVIRGVEGEFYPCKPNIFKKTYEKVEEK